MLSKVNVPFEPSTSEASVLIYKSAKIEEFISLFPQTSSYLKSSYYTIPYVKEAVTDLAQIEEELLRLGMELKSMMDDTLKALERLQ